MRPLKLIVIGPVESGKTTISNFLASATEIPYEYHPTCSVRILEFEVSDIVVNSRQVSRDVELWDCSGNSEKYRHCWPAIKQNADGVIFVCSAKSRGNARQLQEFYDYFITENVIGLESSVLFFYDPEKTTSDIPDILSRIFAKISRVRCTLQDDGEKLKTDFRSFLSTLVIKIQEHAEREEKDLINESVLLFK